MNGFNWMKHAVKMLIVCVICAQRTEVHRSNVGLRDLVVGTKYASWAMAGMSTLQYLSAIEPKKIVAVAAYRIRSVKGTTASVLLLLDVLRSQTNTTASAIKASSVATWTAV